MKRRGVVMFAGTTEFASGAWVFSFPFSFFLKYIFTISFCS
jgi:hypothetical protein